MSWRRASFLALQALGDPDEAGELLAQVHRPWLGWAWKISRWAAVAVSLLLFVAILRLMWEGLPSSYNFRSSVPEPVLQAESKDGPFSLVSRGSGTGSAKIGHYSFRVEDAQILRYEDGGECAFLLLNVRYPFWLHPPFALSYRLSAEDSTGRIFAKAHESGGLIRRAKALIPVFVPRCRTLSTCRAAPSTADLFAHFTHAENTATGRYGKQGII